MPLTSFSNFATAGVEAFGDLGTVPDDHDEFPGLIMAEFVLLSSGEKLVPPCWIFEHFKNGKKEGKAEVRPICGARGTREFRKKLCLCRWGS